MAHQSCLRWEVSTSGREASFCQVQQSFCPYCASSSVGDGLGLPPKPLLPVMVVRPPPLGAVLGGVRQGGEGLGRAGLGGGVAGLVGHSGTGWGGRGEGAVKGLFGGG